MGPTNEHELAIARIVDKLSIDSNLSPTAIEEVITKLDFTMWRSDSEFLVKYIRWRMENPIAK
jgi:SOS response regulatory protein OraA/RecX